ncbi:hypothetical protein DFQ26_005751 [Actinomortierella ambigua]|nr:hypothetical protein DFQ26_005751 [Actinomortierella ambigua]
MDPNDLPDEFFCVECKHPPSPNQPGLFKQLLDNMDRMNPKAFALPLDIRTYFRGVVTNSDGEYSDAMDYKPTPKRHNTNTGTNLSLEDDPLHLRDANGQFKACFRCNKTSLGRQIIRSRNDGDIEVLSDGSDFDERRILLDDGREVSTTDIIYRVPEHSIKLGFVRKCRQLRQQEPQQTQHQSQQRRLQQQERRRSTSDASVSGHDEEVVNGDQESSTAQTDGEGDDETARFRRLVEVATLEARRTGASELLSALAPPLSSHSPLPSEISHAMMIQDVLLKKLESKQEQDEYLQFRAFQRMVREQGAESVVRRMVEEHETRKAEIAMESLLEMKGSSPC